MRKLRVVKESPEQKACNDLELKAWNEWKEVCSILGCSQSYREALKDRMWTKTSREKLQALLEKSYPEWESELSEEGWKDEISKCFDSYIREGAEDKTGRRLNYKDTIWYIIENNPDPIGNPPLRVIRGKLTSSHSVLDNVLEQLVQNKGWTPKVLDHKPIVIGSLNEKVSAHGGDAEDDGRELIETIAASESDSVKDDDRAYVAKLLQDTFSFEECVLLMACFKRVSCANPIVRAACGVAKSRASEMLYGKMDRKTGEFVKPGILQRFERTFECVRDIAKGTNDWGGTVAMLMSILEVRIRAEKRGVEFLCELEAI